MGDYETLDLLVMGNLVDSDRIIENGWLARL